MAFMDTSWLFDKYYIDYDEWYMRNRNIGMTESLCIRRLCPYGRILDIGVGTGALTKDISGLIIGVDPAEKPLLIASKRGILTINAYGENLPFMDEVFDTVIMSVTICFLPDPYPVLREAYRVLKRDGFLILCFVPRSSTWGKYYLFLKYSLKSRFYRYARFYDIDEVYELLSSTGFRVRDICSTLFKGPVEPGAIEEPVMGFIEGAGFYCVRAEKK